MNIKVSSFDWDKGNLGKCQKHGLSIKLIEEFFRGKIHIINDLTHSLTETRHIAVGYDNSNKAMLVCFTLRKKNKKIVIRPISARYMHEKEKRKYEKETSKI